MPVKQHGRLLVVLQHLVEALQVHRVPTPEHRRLPQRIKQVLPCKKSTVSTWSAEVRFSFGETERAWSSGRRTHLVADGAVVLHRVLDAAVLLPQGRRVARSWWQKRNNQETGGGWVQRMGRCRRIAYRTSRSGRSFPSLQLCRNFQSA